MAGRALLWLGVVLAAVGSGLALQEIARGGAMANSALLASKVRMLFCAAV